MYSKRFKHKVIYVMLDLRFQLSNTQKKKKRKEVEYDH